MMAIDTKFVLFLILSLLIGVIPIQLQLQEGEEVKENNVDSQLNDCLSVQRSTEVGVCFGKEVLSKLNQYDETETFSLSSGISFIRDEKTPRDFGNFLEKDPMDFRAMIEDASNLISRRSLVWDLNMVYPGLLMRIGPTLSNGILEFVLDPRIKDRSHQIHGDSSTGRVLAKNLLVPFLLGFKFHLSTLLPLLLGVLLIASKKAFLLATLAFLAVTVFSSSSYGAGAGGGGFGGGFGSGGFGGAPSLSSYTSHPGHFHGHHGSSSGYYHGHPYQSSSEYLYREKSAETTSNPITPDELRDRLERLFITKKELDEPREDDKRRNGRGFSWTPINVG